MLTVKNFIKIQYRAKPNKESVSTIVYKTSNNSITIMKRKTIMYRLLLK